MAVTFASLDLLLWEAASSGPRRGAAPRGTFPPWPMARSTAGSWLHHAGRAVRRAAMPAGRSAQLRAV